ncbi:MAG TPA: hypothetical protein VGN14_13130 [Candidatus Elarobacter sp.]|jgi:hypothetical protein
MADLHQVWESTDGWKVLRLDYFVHQDFDQQPDIGNAFDLVISARVLGAQIGQVILNPLGNGPVTMALAAGMAGTIAGQIDDWQGYLPDGKTTAAWTAGGLGSARFTLTLDIDVRVKVPVLGQIPVQIKGFHKPCTVLLHWDAQQRRYTAMPG